MTRLLFLIFGLSLVLFSSYQVRMSHAQAAADHALYNLNRLNYESWRRDMWRIALSHPIVIKQDARPDLPPAAHCK